MSITDEIIRWLGGIAMVFGGAAWKHLTGRIDVIEQKIVAVSETHIDVRHCKLTGEMRMERIDHLKEDFANMKLDNKEDHAHIGKTLDSITESLSTVQECMTKLSVGKECD